MNDPRWPLTATLNGMRYKQDEIVDASQADSASVHDHKLRLSHVSTVPAPPAARKKQ
jgi:hypothetical protein